MPDSLIHGGDWAGYQQEFGKMPLDFSANISPLGVPPGVRRALRAAAGRADRYPDPLCRALCAALAAHHGLPQGWFLCGNGAAELIFRLAAARRPRTALVTAPTFAEYEQALAAMGCKTARYPLRREDGFAVTEALLEEITPGLGMLFLCEPNNPTGVATPPALLRRVLHRCAQAGTLLVVDECFNDFLPDPAAQTLMGALAEYKNLVLLRAFTKCYAMAGVRLGYALCSDEALLEAMRRSGPPWAVSTLAQEAGVAALAEREYLDDVRAMVGVQRPILRAGLEALGCRTVPGQANYLLFFCPLPGLAQGLRERGILLRDCANYPGLGPGWYRAAVRTGPENTALLRAMGEVLAHG